MPKSQCREYCDREKEIVEQYPEIQLIAEVCARCAPDELAAVRVIGEAQNEHLAGFFKELLLHSENCLECKRE